MSKPMDNWAAPDDPLGAFCRANHIEIRGSGNGPLAGLSFAVKDVFHIEGARTGFGQPDWLRTHAPADETAVAVRRLLDAGADLIGKTHTDEMAYSLSGENVHYGTPQNPSDPARIPGGSSNGSVSAVAGGLVDFALGTDCGGSVRLPASYCGVLGIRSSHARVPVDGIIPFAPSFDAVGWFAREPTILESVGTVILDPRAEVGDRGPRRLLIASDAFAMVDTEVSRALAPAVDRAATSLGVSGEIRVVEAGELRDWFEVFRVLQAAEIWANHGAWVEATRPELGPGIRERFEWAATVTGDQIVAARERHLEIRARLASLFEPGDFLCLPTSPRVAPLKGTPTDKLEVAYRNRAMCLLCIAGLGGLPQISLPMAELNGLPLGLSLVSAPGNDMHLLALAKVLLSSE